MNETQQREARDIGRYTEVTREAYGNLLICRFDSLTYNVLATYLTLKHSYIHALHINTMQVTLI